MYKGGLESRFCQTTVGGDKTNKNQSHFMKNVEFDEDIRTVRYMNGRLLNVDDMNELNLQVEEELDDRDDEELMFKSLLELNHVIYYFLKIKLL